jgi:hypothetical protein
MLVHHRHRLVDQYLHLAIAGKFTASTRCREADLCDELRMIYNGSALQTEKIFSELDDYNVGAQNVGGVVVQYAAFSQHNIAAFLSSSDLYQLIIIYCMHFTLFHPSYRHEFKEFMMVMK